MSNRHGNVTHGWSDTPEYRVWQTMKDRCINPDAVGYENYGGRGIRVCAEWLAGFEPFIAAMGWRPGPSFSIERIDNNGNYEPGNCRWASRREQNNNSRNCRFISWRGETHTVVGWAEKLGLSVRALRDRLSRGWSHDEALGTPTDDLALTRSLRNNSLTITHNGVTQTAAYWARATGLNRTTILYRIRSGWAPADALSAAPDHARKYIK